MNLNRFGRYIWSNVFVFESMYLYLNQNWTKYFYLYLRKSKFLYLYLIKHIWPQPWIEQTDMFIHIAPTPKLVWWWTKNVSWVGIPLCTDLLAWSREVFTQGTDEGQVQVVILQLQLHCSHISLYLTELWNNINHGIQIKEYKTRRYNLNTWKKMA